MKKLFVIPLMVVLAAGLVFSGCAAPAPAPAPVAPAPGPEVKTLKAVGFIPVEDISLHNMGKYADLVKMYSDGKLIIDIVGGFEVIPTEEQIFAVGKGVTDMIFSMGDDISQGSALGLGMSQTNMTPWEEREKGIWDFYREVLAEETNTYWLGHHVAPQWWVLASNIPFKNPEEMKGVKIRSGATHFAALRAVGAVPVSTPMSEIYTAMERGVVDAFVYPASGWIQWGWQDVTKYLCGPRILWGQNSCPLINLDVWNSLTKQQQNWLTQPMLDFEEDWYGFSYWVFAGDEYGEEAILKAGLERIEWTEAENEWFEKTWRDASWDYALGEMKPDVAKRFAELVGRK